MRPERPGMEHTMRKSGQAQHTMIMGWLGEEVRSIPLEL